MSQVLAESFTSDFQQSPIKVRTIYAGANLDTTGAGGKEQILEGEKANPSILFVGKDHRRKGLDVLVEAFCRVREDIPDAVLHVVGASPLWAQRPGIIAHGFIPSGTPEGAIKLRKLYRDASVFCLPTRYEPFGVSFVEAMLAGVPCVGTRSWAVPEIVEEGQTGWLVPDGDVTALADTLRQALGNQEKCAEMGRRGRERALAMFTWDRVADRALEDLNQIAAGTKPRVAGR
jgi:glycosyltransferase involved in cell wall biosynthesis